MKRVERLLQHFNQLCLGVVHMLRVGSRGLVHLVRIVN